MAKYATLKAAVEAAIRTNGQQQITGQILQTQLVNMITSLGKYFQSFGGLATPAGSFTAGDESVTFLAVEAGTYTNFGGAVLDGKTLHILAYDGDWADVDTLIPSGAAFEAALALAIKGSQSGIAEGIADTISAGTAQEFLQRQSGGDGVNCIKRIKGKTIAWNQLSSVVNYTNPQYDTRPALDLRAQWLGVGGVVRSDNLDGTLGSHSYLLTAPASSSQMVFKHNGQIQDFLIFNSETTAGHKYVLFYNVIKADTTVVGGVEVKEIQFHDLTLLTMPDLTVAQFRALYPELHYGYNAGVLKSNDAAALLTYGRNQWDEEWEVDAQNRVRSKYFIPIFPSTSYYFTIPNTGVTLDYYDAEKNLISSAYGVMNQTIITPSNAAYCKFTCGVGYGTTYKNDLCINLSDASFNGTYQPYWQRILALRLSELTGIPEGGTEADRVTMFPNGLRGLGTSYDEIAGGKATIRRGVRAYESGDESDASVITDGTNTDYALATPIVYTDLQYADGTPFTMPATILVDNYGTERIQAPEGATTPSAPFCCDSNYSIGVANLVKRLAALENAE